MSESIQAAIEEMTESFTELYSCAKLDSDCGLEIPRLPNSVSDGVHIAFCLAAQELNEP